MGERVLVVSSGTALLLCRPPERAERQPFSAMDQSLQSYMRVGLVPAAVLPLASADPDGFVRGLEAIAAASFGVVALERLPDAAIRARIAGVLRAGELAAIVEVGPAPGEPALALCAADEALRRRTLAAVKWAIDEAAEMGAVRVNVASGPDPGPDGRDGASDALIESLYELADYTVERGRPALALKPGPRRGPDGALIGPTAEAVGVVRLVRQVYPAVSLTLDSGHVALLDEEMPAALALAAPHLRQVDVRLAPAVRTGRTGPRHTRGGVDSAALAEMLLALFRVGYLSTGRRPLVLLHAMPGADRGRGAAGTIAAMRRALDDAWAQL